MKNRNVLLVVGSSILILIGMLFIGLTSAADDANREQTRKKLELKQKSSSTTTKPPITYYLDDRTSTCTGERELIYTDNTYNYYLPCYKSTTIYLVYNNNYEVTLKEALDTKLVTIDELINNGLEVIKETV